MRKKRIILFLIFITIIFSEVIFTVALIQPGEKSISKDGKELIYERGGNAERYAHWSNGLIKGTWLGNPSVFSKRFNPSGKIIAEIDKVNYVLGKFYDFKNNIHIGRTAQGVTSYLSINGQTLTQKQRELGYETPDVIYTVVSGNLIKRDAPGTEFDTDLGYDPQGFSLFIESESGTPSSERVVYEHEYDYNGQYVGPKSIEVDGGDLGGGGEALFINEDDKLTRIVDNHETIWNEAGYQLNKQPFTYTEVRDANGFLINDGDFTYTRGLKGEATQICSNAVSSCVKFSFYPYPQIDSGNILARLADFQNGDKEEFLYDVNDALAGVSAQYIGAGNIIYQVELPLLSSGDIGTAVVGDEVFSLGGTTYTKNIIGNDVIEIGNNEQCDDGNAVSGDGCSATGQIEAWCEDADYAQTNAAGEINVDDVISNKKIELINLINNTKIAVNYNAFKNGTIPLGWQCPPANLQPGLLCKSEAYISKISSYFPETSACSGDYVDSFSTSVFGAHYNMLLRVALQNASSVIENAIENFVCPENCDKKTGLGIIEVKNIMGGAEFRFQYSLSCLNKINGSVIFGWNEDTKIYGIKTCEEI